MNIFKIIMTHPVRTFAVLTPILNYLPQLGVSAEIVTTANKVLIALGTLLVARAAKRAKSG